jgi:hypothetical protein
MFCILIVFAFGARSRREGVYFGFRHSGTFFHSELANRSKLVIPCGRARSDYLEQKRTTRLYGFRWRRV